MASDKQEKMNEVAVVIPLYKAQPSESEILSFQQCLRVLGDHPIIFVIPKGLDISQYERHRKERSAFTAVAFDPVYFSSTKGYSKLLVSRQFYRSFTEHRFILIYQLDAWVFRNELATWCGLDMDYIGAPWLVPPPLASEKKPLINLSNLLMNKVGNGGFSLRKVQSHLRWTWWTSFVFKFIPKNEDIIWTLLVPFKKPTCHSALFFAFEMEPEMSFKLTQQRLPFGCHAWEKYQPDFWTRYIPQGNE